MATNNYTDMLEELKSAYSNLLIAQYHQGVNSVATIKANIETLLSNMLLWKIRDCWDIDDTELCVGVQLDIVGKWIGVDRYFSGQRFDNKMWFAYYDWNEVDEPNIMQGGYQNWNNLRPETDGAFLTYDWILATKNALNDDDFRFLIRLKIIKNNTVMSCKNIDDAIQKMFGDMLYITWGDVMEITYNYDYTLSSIIELAKNKNCLPVPTGCKIKLQEIA